MEYSTEVPGMGIGFTITTVSIAIAIYVFFSICLAMIAKKTGRPFDKSFIMALIPIANIILLFQMAGKPWWWLFLLLIPVVNIVISVMVWMKICEACGKPGWWGVLICLVPFVNLILLLILAFGKAGQPATA